MSTLTPSQAADLFRREPDRLLDVGAGEVAHRQVGSGPDVLFVHGWPVSGATFRKLVPHLVDHVTCHLIDLPGSGSSRFGNDTTLTIAQHIRTFRRVVDLLDLDDVAVVGHDSGGLIARHAMVGDQRLRAMGLINTEQPNRSSWRFRLFLAARHAPGLAAGLGWVAAQPRVRRNQFVLGGAFADRSLLDGEFDEFFLRPLHEIPERRAAAVRVLRSFDLHPPNPKCALRCARSAHESAFFGCGTQAMASAIRSITVGDSDLGRETITRSTPTASIAATSERSSSSLPV